MLTEKLAVLVFFTLLSPHAAYAWERTSPATAGEKIVRGETSTTSLDSVGGNVSGRLSLFCSPVGSGRSLQVSQYKLQVVFLGGSAYQEMAREYCSAEANNVPFVSPCRSLFSGSPQYTHTPTRHVNFVPVFVAGDRGALALKSNALNFHTVKIQPSSDAEEGLYNFFHFDLIVDEGSTEDDFFRAAKQLDLFLIPELPGDITDLAAAAAGEPSLPQSGFISLLAGHGYDPTKVSELSDEIAYTLDYCSSGG